MNHIPAIDPVSVISQLCKPGDKAYQVLIQHGQAVADRAVSIARRLGLSQDDQRLVHEAAMLHDIGMLETDTPKLGCRGREPYIRHGVIGRRMLEGAGLPVHALVCERHVGVGLTVDQIRAQKLPLPLRDMQPVSLAEQIICYADKFYSKNGNGPDREKDVRAVVERLIIFGRPQVEQFCRWAEQFEGIRP